jgi:hypothetical protein
MATDNAKTSGLTFISQVGSHAVYRDPAALPEEEYPFVVVDADGDIMDSFATYSEARRDAKERDIAYQAEKREEILSRLRGQINDEIESIDDVEILRAVLVLIRKGR